MPQEEDYMKSTVEDQERQINPYSYISRNEPHPLDEAKGNPKLMGIFFVVTGTIIFLMGATISFLNSVIGGVRGYYDDGVLLYTRFLINGFRITFNGVVLPVLVCSLVGGFFIFIGIKYVQRSRRLKQQKSHKQKKKDGNR